MLMIHGNESYESSSFFNQNNFSGKNINGKRDSGSNLQLSGVNELASMNEREIFVPAEDYNETQGVTSLTEAHKNAIRAIRKIKYFVARRKFQQARKPYDVRDVIEQYSQGHLNMMVRIKELQRRLDQTLGKPGNYHHGIDKEGHIKPMTIGARLYRVENQMSAVDRKLDHMTQMLQQVLQLQHEQLQPSNHSSLAHHQEQPTE